MNIIIAPDSYKGSLTASKVAETMKKAVIDINNTHAVMLKPMADGGEGTIDAMLSSIKGERISIDCTGPLGEKITTSYAILDSKQAVIELATVSGLVQVPTDKRNPDYTTTFGLGEVIRDALDKGCTSIIIGLGGSATNDGGLGMLLALGMKAWDEKGNKLKGFGADLHRVKKVSFADLDVRIPATDIKVACDVNNPLCGSEGASVVYGPQKGASQSQVYEYNKSLDAYGSLIEKATEKSLKDFPGAGAAGGVGFALLAIGADLVSGAKLLATTMQLEEAIKNADIVITGEGQSDEQTLYGKAPGHVALLAKKYEVPVVLVSGSLTGDLNILRERFSGCFSIINKPLTLEQCMAQAESLLYEQTKQVIHFASSLVREI
ncbi:glycerate kinase [Oceanobacillus sp. CF4.6]|uniref:glycerate kinase n=1 Tax=Oceanobacillus sp. CF4.6 TaxID=3373080 RepID=UPI003EE67564